MTTMKAVRIYSYGGPEVLSYEDVARPQPGDGEVLVRVHAASINPIDWKIREGKLEAMLHHKLPLVLGWDVSGVIEAIGPSGGGRFKVGAEIFSRPDVKRDGAYAEYIVIRESEVALKPRSIDYLGASAIPLAGLAAWKSIFEAGGLQAGQRVLIHAGSGGVGTFAIQFAKWKGAYVITTASRRNHELLRSLGADEIIDHQATRFEEVVRDVDLVFDTLGGETQERSWAVLRRGGILVSIVSPPAAEKAAAHGVRQAFVFIEPDSLVLAEIAQLVDQGKVRPVVETVLPLEQARRAHELSQEGHTRGKIVLQII